MNFDIQFNDNITFLIGINGSAKTTILKFLFDLLGPSYKSIKNLRACQMAYFLPTFGTVMDNCNQFGLVRMMMLISYKIYRIGVKPMVSVEAFGAEECGVNSQWEPFPLTTRKELKPCDFSSFRNSGNFFSSESTSELS